MSAKTTVTLHGGPLDGMTTEVDADDPDPWIAIIAEGCAPDAAGVWRWTRDIPWHAM